jgi:hypothetical protein
VRPTVNVGVFGLVVAQRLKASPTVDVTTAGRVPP